VGARLPCVVVLAQWQTGCEQGAIPLLPPFFDSNSRADPEMLCADLEAGSKDVPPDLRRYEYGIRINTLALSRTSKRSSRVRCGQRHGELDPRVPRAAPGRPALGGGLQSQRPLIR